VAKAGELQTRIKQRLLDQKPLSDDDAELLDELIDTSEEVLSVWHALTEEMERLALINPDDARSATRAVMDAFHAAVRAIKEARTSRSGSSH
jgi:hypothetical protein